MSEIKQLNKLLKSKGLSKEVRSQFVYDIDTYEKAIVLKGETKPHKEIIKEIGGRWNATIGGWVFSKKSVSKSVSSELEFIPTVQKPRTLPHFIPSSIHVWVACFNLFEELQPLVIGVFQSSHSAYCELTKFLCNEKDLLNLSDKKKQKLMKKMNELQTKEEQSNLLMQYTEDAQWSFVVQETTYEFPKSK